MRVAEAGCMSSENDSGAGETGSEESDSSDWESGLTDVSLGSDNVFHSGSEVGENHENRRGCKRKFEELDPSE